MQGELDGGNGYGDEKGATEQQGAAPERFRPACLDLRRERWLIQGDPEETEQIGVIPPGVLLLASDAALLGLLAFEHVEG